MSFLTLATLLIVMKNYYNMLVQMLLGSAWLLILLFFAGPGKSLWAADNVLIKKVV